VKPEDVSVLDPTADPVLTLVTCYPFRFVGGPPKRYVVTARLVESNQDGQSSAALSGSTRASRSSQIQ
jgi:sortase A